MVKRTISLTKLTPVQLQQRLIYTQSELAKYKHQVERYQNDYYYGLIDELQEKNEQLIQQNEELNKHVAQLKEECALQEKLQQENKKLNKQIALLKEECALREKLQQENEKLNKQIALLKEECALREKLQQENEKLEAERQKLEQQLTDHNSLQPLQTKKQLLETEVAEATQQLTDLKKEIERLTNEEESVIPNMLGAEAETNEDSSPAITVDDHEESSWFVRNLKEKKKKR